VVKKRKVYKLRTFPTYSFLIIAKGDNMNRKTTRPTYISTIGRTILGLSAAALLGGGLIFAYDILHPFDKYQPCSHKVERGETLYKMCASEGVPEKDISDCTRFIAAENTWNRVDGTTTPAFDHDADGNPIPSTLREGALLTVPDVNSDGKVLEQKCQ